MSDKPGLPSKSRMILVTSIPLSVAAWFGLYHLLPAGTVPPEPIVRLGTAFVWLAISALFCLGAGVEAVAHERLRSAAFDPLQGAETSRLRVNQRYLQNTLEQFCLLAPGMLGLAYYADGPHGMRAIPATALVWIATRYAFWIGYHRGPAYRAAGIPGLIIPLALLLYVAARFGYDTAGAAGATIPVGLFLALEVVLFVKTAPGELR